jgi:hypothetical protein
LPKASWSAKTPFAAPSRKTFLKTHLDDDQQQITGQSTKTRTKMKSKYHYTLLIAVGSLILVFAACKPKSVFLESNRILIDSAKVSLKQVQFYNDKPIILRRKATESEISESGGRMVEVDGDQVQEILIKKGTPGVLAGNQNGKLLVRFERGEGKTLRFYKNSKGAYQIDAEKWVAKKGIVKYADLDFLIEPESNDVLLMFRETKRFRSTSALETVKGVKVKSR